MPVGKRSVTIQGHRTSFTLEEPFWLELKRLAKSQNMSVSRLVTRVDSRRADDESLSSALRLHVLAALQREAGRA